MTIDQDKMVSTIDNQLAWLKTMADGQWSPAFLNDPMREIFFAQSVFALIVGFLEARGFVIPEVVDAADDPLQFCHEAAAVLRKFRPFLMPVIRSPFEPITPEMTVQ